MSEHFDLLIDNDERDAWESDGWSKLSGRFALSFKLPENQGSVLCETCWPLDEDPEYQRLVACYDRAVEEMEAVGAPYVRYPLVPVRFGFDDLAGIQFLGAFARFFGDRLRLIIVNAWFTEYCEDDDDIVAILMHELLHAGLHGVDDPELRNGHGRIWYHWAEALEREYEYEHIYDHDI